MLYMSRSCPAEHVNVRDAHLPVKEARRVHLDPEAVGQLDHVAANDVLDGVAICARLARLVGELREVVGAHKCGRCRPAAAYKRTSPSTARQKGAGAHAVHTGGMMRTAVITEGSQISREP